MVLFENEFFQKVPDCPSIQNRRFELKKDQTLKKYQKVPAGGGFLAVDFNSFLKPAGRLRRVPFAPRK